MDEKRDIVIIGAHAAGVDAASAARKTNCSANISSTFVLVCALKFNLFFFKNGFAEVCIFT